MSGETFQMITTLLGGLALFIYGMNSMSDGFQKAAGDRMKSVLSLLTSNPIMGVLAGALCTAVLQSSSATTVMAIGFVSAGLMTLRQAIGVIMGANIGTTITAQLIAFKIGDYAWLFVFIGFIMFFFLKKREKVKDLGQIIFSFGLLFVGINVMGEAMQPLATSPVFMDWMVSVQDIPALGVLIGTTMTVVVQSSSATIAVLQNLAATAGPDGVSSIIGLTGALPILFGDNIGTTITAVLASIGASLSAKRAAAAHVLFNLSGTLIYIWFIPQIAEIVTAISPKGAEVDVISRQIANAHLLFNVTTTLIWLPMISILAAIVTKLIPGSEEERLESVPRYLDHKIIDRPLFAIHLATKELTRLARITLDMTKLSKTAFLEGDRKASAKVMEKEEAVNQLENATVDYLASILATDSVTDKQTETISHLIHVAGDIEHVGDHCKNIVELAEEKQKHKYEFSTRANAELDLCFDQGSRILRYAIKALDENDQFAADSVLRQEEEINKNEERLRKQHMQRVYDKTCSPAFTVVYNDAIHQVEKIGDCCKNIALAVKDMPDRAKVDIEIPEDTDGSPEKEEKPDKRKFSFRKKQ